MKRKSLFKDNLASTMKRWGKVAWNGGFSHVQRQMINAPMRKSDLIQVKRMKIGKWRPKIKIVKK